MAGCSQMGVEVVIQRNAYARVVPCDLQNISVFCPIHADLGDMNSINSFPAKDHRCMKG